MKNKFYYPLSMICAIVAVYLSTKPNPNIFVIAFFFIIAMLCLFFSYRELK